MTMDILEWERGMSKRGYLWATTAFSDFKEGNKDEKRRTTTLKDLRMERGICGQLQSWEFVCQIFLLSCFCCHELVFGMDDITKAA